VEPLGESEIEAALARVDLRWRREGDTIVAEVVCADFAGAVDLVNAIAEQAQRADHHPDILLHDYRHLTVTLSTHAAGGLTHRDFALAQAIDDLLAR
jgi:4a-hydroxytetrahydrobiopterin dehydratase